jgi:hypothetical protein
MWGSPRATKWGATATIKLNDGTGQGNTIANFPTFVQGAAAQFDLWRAVYKNMTLAAAITKWSGGNSHTQYVDWLAKKVGITPKTVITEAFLAGAGGLALMKAQADWEAGKPYPMTAAEWKQAQAMVFKGKVGPQTISDIRVVPPHAEKDERVEAAQNILKSKGYFEVGKIDGLWGGRTVGALNAFLTDRHVSRPVSKDEKGVRPDVEQELKEAAADPRWMRPTDPVRATITEKELAKTNVAVSQSILQRFGAQIVGWLSAGSAAVVGAADNFPDVNEKIAPVKALFANTQGWVWFLIIAGGSLAVWYSARHIGKATLTDKVVGKIN